MFIIRVIKAFRPSLPLLTRVLIRAVINPLLNNPLPAVSHN